MAVNEDVLELIQILVTEGFGVLAGELLAELSARSDRGFLVADADELVGEDDEEDNLQSSGTQPAGQTELDDAVQILKLRLVEPARHLADAERIAARIGDRKLVAIRFVTEDGIEGVDVPTSGPPGNSASADALGIALTRIALSRRPRQN